MSETTSNLHAFWIKKVEYPEIATKALKACFCFQHPVFLRSDSNQKEIMEQTGRENTFQRNCLRHPDAGRQAQSSHWFCMVVNGTIIPLNITLSK